MRLFLIILQITLFLPNTLLSQNPGYLELRGFSGFVAPHRIGMESLAQDPIRGFELNIFRKNTEFNPYNIFYNFPKTGFGVQYDNPGNPSVLGRVLSAYSFIEFDLLSINNRLMFTSRLAMGLAYVSQTFDSEKNPENVAVSTNISYKMMLDFGLKYEPVESDFIYSLSFGLLHYSNGAVIKPNKGLNQIFFSAGLSYNLFNNSKFNNTRTIKTPSEYSYKEHEFWGMFTLFTSDEYAYGDIGRGGGFYCSTLALGYTRRYSHAGKYGIAIDAFYNENFQYAYDHNSDTLIKIINNRKDVLRGGISFGHEFIYHDLCLVTYAGFYYYNRIKPNEWLYTRIGLRYYVFDNLFINLTLKAYGFKAYYIESGIGFALYGGGM